MISLFSLLRVVFRVGSAGGMKAIADVHWDADKVITL